MHVALDKDLLDADLDQLRLETIKGHTEQDKERIDHKEMLVLDKMESQLPEMGENRNDETINSDGDLTKHQH
jgi:hypothetical protein